MSTISSFIAGMTLNYIDAVCVGDGTFGTSGSLFQVTYGQSQVKAFAGFVSSACASGASVGVYMPGEEVYGFTGLIPGNVYYLNGNIITVKSALLDGNWTMSVGVAKTASTLLFDKGEAYQVGASAANTYNHVQSVAANPWTINHNLGFYPDVFVTDSSGNEIDAAVQNTSTNQTVITFITAQTGRARLD